MNTLKNMKWFILVSGILVTILGITMFFTPLANLMGLVIFIGIAMLVSGISEITTFCGEEKGQRSGWVLASGILSVLFSIWTLFGSGSAALLTIFPFIFAAWVMASSVMRISGSFSAKAAGSNMWGWLLAFGILGTVLSFILMFSPYLSAMIVAYLIAFTFIAHGINNIIIFFNAKNLQKNIEDRFGK